MIGHILASEEITATRAAVAAAPDKIQREIAEEIKNMLRRTSVDRAKAKRALRFLDQAFGRSLINQAAELRAAWRDGHDDQAFVDAICGLAGEFGREPVKTIDQTAITRDQLRLVCFQMISA